MRCVLKTFLFRRKTILLENPQKNCKFTPIPQKVVRTDAATHAVPAWKMSTQGKTGRKKILKIKDFMKFL